MSDGGPAFPVHFGDRHSETGPDRGMSLRDYLAAAALPAVIMAYHESAEGPVIGTEHILRNVPIIAYRFADAMLREREASAPGDGD